MCENYENILSKCWTIFKQSLKNFLKDYYGNILEKIKENLKNSVKILGRKFRIDFQIINNFPENIQKTLCELKRNFKEF